LKKRAPQKRKKKGSPEVRRIFENRKKCTEGFLAAYWRFASQKGKLYISVSKKVLPLAHERNRAKRIIRETYRLWPAGKKEKCQIMIQLREKPGALSSACFKKSLEPLLEKIYQ